MKHTFYITTTTPYVNAKPHLGHALEFIQADAVARFHRLLGDTVVFNTGTDEHGLKVYRKAQENNMLPQTYCDEYSEKFQKLYPQLGVAYTHFIRTTDSHHVAAAQAFWQRCMDNGDIYKKNYQVKYCVGCELEKTDSELVDGECEYHPGKQLEIIDEENYFFKFSAYQDQLVALYDTQKDFVVPANRLQEIRNFVASGLQDFSISRLKEKMPWGVPVPGDDEHVMYVWFDALVNYISTLGWPEDTDNFERHWPGVQVAGTDNLRQQSAMWQAMLFSAGLPPSKQIFIHGFITSEGQKMSKSIGNVVDPYDIIDRYGTDAVRYFLLGGLPSYKDGDFSRTRFEEYYTAHLVNGVGNLTSRILTMIEKYADGEIPKHAEDTFDTQTFWQQYHDYVDTYQFDKAVELTQQLVGTCDEVISREKPWEKAKAGEDISALLYQLTECLRHIGLSLLPIIPHAAEQILNQLDIDSAALGELEHERIWGKLAEGGIIKKSDTVLFERLSK